MANGGSLKMHSFCALAPQHKEGFQHCSAISCVILEWSGDHGNPTLLFWPFWSFLYFFVYVEQRHCFHKSWTWQSLRMYTPTNPVPNGKNNYNMINLILACQVKTACQHVPDSTGHSLISLFLNSSPSSCFFFGDWPPVKIHHGGQQPSELFLSGVGIAKRRSKQATYLK